MNEHPFEATLLGKALLLAAKALAPLVILALLIVAPTFAQRRLVLDSYLLDFLLRALAAAILSGQFWLLPDIEWKFNPHRRGWSSRIWVQLAAYDRGRLFLPAFCLFSALFALLGALLTFSALNVFLPKIEGARWLLAALVFLQMAVLMAVQYAPFRNKVARPPASVPPPPAPPARRIPAAGPTPTTYRPTTRTARGVVIPRRPPRE